MKKIIAIVAVIATITACLCIGANAQENEGYTLTTDTVITFKTIPMPNRTLEYNISCVIRDNGQWVSKNISNMIFNDGTITIHNIPSGIQSGFRYDMLQDNQITILAGQTISETDIEYLESNTDFTVPKPSPIKNTLDNTNATFATTLTVASAIIAWLMANQIALVGLYMYILITLVLIGKRYIKGV